jgi:uncharacterized protein YndB with AHSA1/START domain
VNAKNDAVPARELTLIRIFDAPRELVFKLWTEPAHLARWWGPRGFTNPVCELDPRPGGAIRVHLRAADGTIYPMGGMVEEVAPPRRLVFTTSAHAGDESRPFFVNLNTVTFEDLGEKTKLTLHVRVIEAGPEAEAALAGMDQGWSESLDRLLDLAAAEAGSAERHIVGTRLLNAPRELVWKTWTDPKHVAEWWGPKGFTNTIQEMDVRPGGVWRLILHGPDGTDYPNKSFYVEVVEPQLLVFDHVSGPRFRFCATFIAEGEKTRVSVRMLFPSAAQRDKTAKEFGAVEGLNQTLERLANYASAMAHQ